MSCHFKVTSSEFFSTSDTVQFPGVDACKWREAFHENAKSVDMVSAIGIDWRNPKRRTPVLRNIVFLYSHRPKFIDNEEANGFSPLWHLSLFEFLVHWTVDLARYSLDAEILREEEESDDYQAVLGASGRKKLQSGLPLLPGTDYNIKTKWANNGAWATLPATGATCAWRHDWIFTKHIRPFDVHFARCPMPREGPGQEDKNAALILTYFHPFTLHADFADKHVPHMNQLRTPGASWPETLLQWFSMWSFMEGCLVNENLFFFPLRGRKTSF